MKNDPEHMHNIKTTQCQHQRRALGWTIICHHDEHEYGDDSDQQTLDAIGADFEELQNQGLYPMLVQTGECLDCKLHDWLVQDEIVGRYRVRKAVGVVQL